MRCFRPATKRPTDIHSDSAFTFCLVVRVGDPRRHWSAMYDSVAVSIFVNTKKTSSLCRAHLLTHGTRHAYSRANALVASLQLRHASQAYASDARRRLETSLRTSSMLGHAPPTSSSPSLLGPVVRAIRLAQLTVVLVLVFRPKYASDEPLHPSILLGTSVSVSQVRTNRFVVEPLSRQR